MKKCKKCGAPLEGFLYNTIGKLMGIKPSASDPEICNKCIEETAAEANSEIEKESPESVAQPEEATNVAEDSVPAEPASGEQAQSQDSDEKKESAIF